MVVARTYYVLPPEVPGVAVFVLAAMALGAWVGTYLLLRRLGGGAWTAKLLPLVRVAVGIVAMMLIFDAAARTVLFSTDWPIWLLAVLAAVCVEVLLALYALERRVAPGRGARFAVGLRIALAIGLILMLAQPVWSWDLDRGRPKTVAVLLDNSGSMHISQKYLGPADKVRLGEAMSVVDRPYKLDALRGELSVIQRRLIEVRDWLNTLRSATPDIRGRQMLMHGKAHQEKLGRSLEAVTACVEDVWGDGQAGRVFPDGRGMMANLTSTISGPVSSAVEKARGILAGTDADELAGRHGELLDRIGAALADLAKVQRAAGPLADKLDAAYYAWLDAAARGKLDALADKTRYELAREVLEHRRRGAESFLAQIEDQYAVDLYVFDSTIREMALSGISPQGDLTPTQQRTAIAGALEKVLSEADQSRLVGVVVLSDMHHNGPGDVRDVARRFGWKSIPVCPVVFGSSHLPPDAAIASISAPETLFPGDKLFVSAKLKLDGLAGKDVVVTLSDGDKEVDRKVIRVPDVASLRHEVQFSCTPESKGDHTYTLKIDPVEGEALAGNNTMPFSVKVHDDRTQMLLIDSRPRWEMRYLKNLFVNRDASVSLQYVMLYPDRTAGQPRTRVVHASTSRPRGLAEASALPETEAEWLKFDVIILGDVSPDDLGDQAAETLRKFVVERAGTLICIAGQDHMPHAYADESPLTRILPVTFEQSTDVPEMPEKAFRIDLTPEGRHSVIMRMEVEPARNKRVWDELPDIYWRHPLESTKSGATVLAYARGADVPGPLRSDMDAEARKARLAEIREYQRKRALVVTQSVGRGRVMFLGFDRTWRMRFRQGDTYHHRFWGQTLRWAMAGRLSSGTALVKMGTDRTRYTMDDRVRVRARILRPEDNSPLLEGDVAVELYRDKELIMRRDLAPVADAPGTFAGDLGKRKAGAYRVVLVGRSVIDTLRRENAAQSVETIFTVTAAPTGEQVELAADRVLAAQTASASGGVSVEPARIQRVLEALGIRKQTAPPKRSQWDLWDSWPMLVAMLLLLTSEWLIRKRIGLT